MATPGVDYTLTGIPSKKTRERLRAMNVEIAAVSCGIQSWQVSYQRCRFCGRGWPKLKRLLKYAVRHYVCDDCREHYIQTAPGLKR